jgi:hypothetical protein
MKMETKQKEKTIVRCTDASCRAEFEGDSIQGILSNARCGRDGGVLKESCKTCLRSDGQNLFEVVPKKLNFKKKDNDTKSKD